jgi:hypothetical protein
MKKFRVAALLFVGLVLAGCDDKPSDSLAGPVIRKWAEENKAKGLDIANFERANGQVDPNSANLYKVTYSYNLKLTKHLAEAVLENAMLYQKEVAASAKRETGQFFDTTALQNNVNSMQQSMVVNQWVANQDSGFKERRDAFLNACAPCVAWWNGEDAPAEAKNRRMLFLTAWIEMEQYGFKDTAKVGDAVPRLAWAFFSKTEKGWQETN